MNFRSLFNNRRYGNLHYQASSAKSALPSGQQIIFPKRATNMRQESIRNYAQSSHYHYRSATELHLQGKESEDGSGDHADALGLDVQG